MRFTGASGMIGDADTPTLVRVRVFRGGSGL
ncbi:hypothetical protein Ae505Ps2_6131c [Pseudonocardia sp. Ae505_Ps2]|nr:hypothetical protein Ae505Ps2_6131c [Pseudonocardia sp. Ae505_Ps2]